MTRELLVFRHGKSDWTSDASSDFERPLAKRGKKAVKQMGAWLEEQGHLPDCILSSPALRAKQTTLRLCRFAGMDESGITWLQAFYEAGHECFPRGAGRLPREQRTRAGRRAQSRAGRPR